MKAFRTDIRDIHRNESLGVPRVGNEIDCSQFPYFSVGFSILVRFDGVVAILVCKSQCDLWRMSKLPRGAEVGVS